MPLDPERMADMVSRAIETATSPLLIRIASLERELQTARGRDGKDGERGERGADGQVGATGPTGPQGEPGPAGPQGERGERGERGESGEAGARGLQGEQGPAGPQGERGAIGEKGMPGNDGADGKSITVDDIKGVIELEVTRALLDLERRSMDVLQRAIDRIPAPKDGKDGKDGEKGADGLGWQDFEWETDDVGRLAAKYQRGDVVKRALVPGFVHRGLFTEGTPYLRGDSVTWGGGQWIALKDTDGSVKPDQPANGTWQLSVMRGKQGERGHKGEKGDAGVNGRDGRDLTHTKW